MSGLDRRDFVKKAGLGAAGAGALWVAPSVLGYNAAFAGTSCHQEDTLNWGNYSAGNANPTPVTYNAVGSYPAVTVTMAVAAVNSPGAGNNPSSRSSTAPSAGLHRQLLQAAA